LDSENISESKSHAQYLTVMIDELLKVNNINPHNLDAVAVSAGPGSYTGLRIGVSVAKAISYALDIFLIAVPTLEIMLETVLQSDLNIPDNESNLYIPMIDARRMEVYQAVYTADRKTLEDISPKILKPDAYQKLLNNHKISIFGSGAEKAEQIIQHKNAYFIPNIEPQAEYMIPVAINKFYTNDFEDTAYYEPFYLKDFQATTPKNKLF
ncbi:MAG: tRNA (adenosine(37)-N6)-threonylcarbamoyltransferase complex dimerization subunit type 1 TsaB, partial [Bacteroidales bacterium]